MLMCATTPPSRFAALTLLLVGLCASVVRAADKEDEERITPQEGARVVLTMIAETDLSDAPARTELVVRLAATDPEMRLGLIHAYAAVAGHSIRPERSELLDDVFDRMGKSALSRLLLEATRKESETIERTVALRLLREREIPGGMRVVLAAAANEPQEQLRRPFVARALRESAAVMLERDPSGIDALSERIHRLPPEVQDIFLDVIERQSPAVGTREMSRFLGSDPRLNASVIPRLARLPITQERPLVESADSHIAWSLRGDDAETRRLAVYAISRFHLVRHVDALVSLLEDPQPRVAAAARAALISMTGVKLRGRVDLWVRRLSQIRGWKDARLDDLIEQAADADTESAVKALLELRRHRFHRESIAPRLQGACSSRDPKTRVAACQALEALGSPSSMTILLARLDDRDPAVIDAASSALTRITGLPRPENPAEWRTILRARF